MEYTRNSDLSYYDEDYAEANCGSYDLRLNEWYDPEDYLENLVACRVDEWIVQMGPDHTDEEITDIYSEILLEGMLKEFEGELEICDGAPPKTDDVELIAFNTFCCYFEETNYSDFDFHFRVFRDGKWKEKCGWGNVQDCEDNDNWGRYTGEVVYLYHKIKEVGNVE